MEVDLFPVGQLVPHLARVARIGERLPCHLVMRVVLVAVVLRLEGTFVERVAAGLRP